MAQNYRDRIGGFIVKMIGEPIECADEYAQKQKRFSISRNKADIINENPFSRDDELMSLDKSYIDSMNKTIQGFTGRAIHTAGLGSTA